MKVLVIFALGVACVAAADFSANTAFGHIQNVAIPLGEAIRKAEEAYKGQRIVGGSETPLGMVPYQVGLLSRYQGIEGTGICGGSLVSADRVITAAHCWYDGLNQAYVTTVVLGSVTLFTGGERIDTSAVIPHPNWFPYLIRNDVAIIYLPRAVAFSNTIAPIALPSGAELSDTFVGETALASGFGQIGNSVSITVQQSLSHVNLNIITNSVCFLAHPLFLQDSNICTSSVGNKSVCKGDSGGPLAVTRNNRKILVGITSFGSPLGCEAGMPAVFARITSYMDFFKQHL